MKTFLVSYDLRAPETSADYKRVSDYLRSFSTWAKPLYSLWFVKTDKTTDQVRNELRNLSDANDRILVVDITPGPWATYGLHKELLDWMHANM